VGADAADDAALLEAAVREAGEIALSFFRRNPAQWTKGATSPVSEADLAIDAHLHARLTQARPEYGWLSEETADSSDRLSRRRLFVIDPIDGTRAFLAGKEEWMVALAVVSDGRPVAAALVAPALGDVYIAHRGGGALRNGHRIRASEVGDPAEARAAGAKADLPVLLPVFAETVPRVPSLALRITRVADGTLDAAFAAGNAHDWDIAAADLLVMEAGGRLTDFTDSVPRYNTPRARHGALFAAGATLHTALLAKVQAPSRKSRETGSPNIPISPGARNGA
jgi:myo-inositol-1(or 4)-monophosphatase